jgi:hypothetical protein
MKPEKREKEETLGEGGGGSGSKFLYPAAGHKVYPDRMTGLPEVRSRAYSKPTCERGPKNIKPKMHSAKVRRGKRPSLRLFVSFDYPLPCFW